MDPRAFGELRKLLEKNLKVSEENNKILHKMHRSMKWASILRAIYWVVIVGSAVGAYYFLQPFIDGARENVETIFSGVEALQDLSGIDSLFGQ